MKTYLVLAFTAPDAAPSEGGSMDDWKTWMAKNEDSLVDMGSPLANGVEGTPSGGYSEIKPDMWPAQGYMMIQATDMAAAQAIMADSPLGADMPLRIFEKAEMPDMA
ncbi:MAG: hypothetical protein AAF413_00655 [Patescibacteria group bacterium]